MKNWKYIEGAKTGNTAHSDKVEVIKRLLHANWSVQEIYELLKKEGYEVDKNFIERMKTGNDTPWEYAHRKPKVINEDKTGAEEFFKKLSDDVKEREKKDDKEIEKVGNKVVWKEGPYRIEEVEKDGKFGFYNIPKGSFNAYRNSVLYGNFKTLDSAKAKMNEEIRLDKEYNRKYTTNSKFGNAKDKNGKELRVGDIVLVWTSAGERAGKVKTISGDRITVAIRNEGDWSTPGKLADKVSNSKVGNYVPNYRYKDFLITNPEGYEFVVFLKDGRTVGYRGTTSKAQAEDWCDWHDPKTGKSIGNKKLKFTDKKDGLKEFVYDEENDKGYIYYDGKLVDTIPHAGQGWLNLIKQKAFSSGVMNKVGNSAYDDGAKKGKEDKRKGKLITAAGFEYHAPGYSSLSFKEKEEYKKGYYSTNDLKKEDIYKWGNSASDDKFAYVMKEFDAGKLKTPDGKVVTDPAQAKAIAYSESKKTENGLARARKAMNKGITMWKGNDSAYIKEDGTVSYLENNSFETDKDKFESQESAIKELSKQGYVKK